jgi:hypothetical protein
MTIVAWVAGYFAFVLLIAQVAHCAAVRMDRRDQGAGDCQPVGARSEVESVPVHVTCVADEVAR